MNFQEYKRLAYILSKASIKKNRNVDYGAELNSACESIEKLLSNSKDKITTIWEIERTCLVYDRDCSIDKDRTKLHSRFTGCLAAIKDYKDLMQRPDVYSKEFTAFQPYNAKAETTFTKESFNTLKYLGVEKNAVSTTTEGRLFYEKRQNIIKEANKKYLEKKEKIFEKYQPKPFQKENSKDHDRER